jgi:hypothetical protein
MHLKGVWVDEVEAARSAIPDGVGDEPAERTASNDVHGANALRVTGRSRVLASFVRPAEKYMVDGYATEA